MALLESKALIRLSRMRVMFGIDPEMSEYSYELGLFPQDSSKGLKKLIIDLPSMHLIAAELEACTAVLKAHIAYSERTMPPADAEVQ